MSRGVKLAAAAAGMVVGAALWWRYAARRRSMPCPTWLAGLLDHSYSHLMPPPLERLELEPGQHVLDVGCGPGRLSIPVAKAVGPQGEVLAFDLQPGMLERLKRRMAQAGVANITPTLGDIINGGVPPASFDRALLVTVLGEIPDRLAALRAIHGALKPGGVLSITEILGDPHYQSRSTVLRLAQEAGFRFRREYRGLANYTLNFERN
jgi:ubiquinone/menaquinone biosynthesis C-methylase UbiE